MERRDFTTGLAIFGACLLGAGSGFAGEGMHWGYRGGEGPGHWAELDTDYTACAHGSQQSPLNISHAVSADIPGIAIGWHEGGGTMVNNGHTIQVDMPKGSSLSRGDEDYVLMQVHFHAPSEHHVDGKSFPMEVHFVHRNAHSGALGVLAVFLTPGAANKTFAGLAAAFPEQVGEEVSVSHVDPNGLLPDSLGYWIYEGSLTTPPCSENVDWMIAKEPVEADAADIEKFKTLYPMNARPMASPSRRFILSTQ